MFIFLSGFKSLNKGSDYNFNSLFTGCVACRDLSCQVNGHLPVSCPAYSKKKKKEKKKKTKTASPQPLGGSRYWPARMFSEQGRNLAFLLGEKMQGDATAQPFPVLRCITGEGRWPGEKRRGSMGCIHPSLQTLQKANAVINSSCIFK